MPGVDAHGPFDKVEPRGAPRVPDQNLAQQLERPSSHTIIRVAPPFQSLGPAP